jgi:hypothetical protein
MTAPNDSAFATSAISIDQHTIYAPGLTKREYFAALALNGLCSSMNWKHSIVLPEGMASDSLEFADALIEELNKPPPPPKRLKVKK